MRAKRPTKGRHDRLSATVGLDGVITVGCECGQVWVIPDGDLTNAQRTMTAHALYPNVGDPRTYRMGTGSGGPPDMNPSDVERGAFMAEQFAKFRRTKGI